jgi:hypothetical protein
VQRGDPAAATKVASSEAEKDTVAFTGDGFRQAVLMRRRPVRGERNILACDEDWCRILSQGSVLSGRRWSESGGGWAGRAELRRSPRLSRWWMVRRYAGS